MALLIGLLTCGCATVASPGAIDPQRSLVSTEFSLRDVQEPIAMPLAEIGKPLCKRNARSHVDWAGALGMTRERVRTWPVLRSLRAIQPKAFDHMGLTLDHDQIGLSYSTRF
jgi:hypothetical protein